MPMGSESRRFGARQRARSTTGVCPCAEGAIGAQPTIDADSAEADPGHTPPTGIALVAARRLGAPKEKARRTGPLQHRCNPNQNRTEALLLQAVVLAATQTLYVAVLRRAPTKLSLKVPELLAVATLTLLR